MKITARKRELEDPSYLKSRRKPTLTILVASIMDPTTVTKSKMFHESLKYGCKTKSK